MKGSGQTGHGNSAGAYSSNPFSVVTPDDDIAHPCNKLVVSLRSLMLGKYRIAPYREGEGFISLTYVDNDGGNPTNESCQP